jgi:hemoglobin-like flavoprotein
VRDWLWHLFHDPIRDNPWSFAALIVIVVAGLAAMLLLGGALHEMRKSMFRRRSTEGDDVDPTSTEPVTDDRYVTNATQRLDRGEAPYTGDGYAGSARQFTDGGSAQDTLVPAPDPVTDTSARLAASEILALRAPCPHCRGKGYVMTTSDLLRESVALLKDHEDDAVLEFYARLLRAAPALAQIFPSDLLAPRDPLGDPDSAGIRQRDKLYGALEALATTYDPQDDLAMTRLCTALQAFGRSHASFYRPAEQVTRGATWEEYGAVKAILFATLHDLAGEAWLPEYDAAWAEAYDFAAGEMIREQHRWGLRSARYPREAQ